MNRRTFSRLLLAGAALAPGAGAHTSVLHHQEPAPASGDAAGAGRFLARHEERMVALRAILLPNGLFPALPPTPPRTPRTRRTDRG
jgi:hypothetical protein